MGLPQFDEEVIRDLATETSYERGEEYADYGAVRNLVVEGETYRAHVYGTHRYTVRVWDESGDIGSSCTCPYDWGGVCKHVVAVMLSVPAVKPAVTTKEKCPVPSTATCTPS